MTTSRKILLGVVGVVVIGLGLGYSLWYAPLRGAVDIGAGLLAKQVCSCVYVANRDVADCRADQFESMDAIQLEVIREDERVRAWVPGFGERTAVHREGLGCTFE